MCLNCWSVLELLKCPWIVEVSFWIDHPPGRRHTVNLAASAIAGLASTEDFTKVRLKKTAGPDEKDEYRGTKSTMLIHIKGFKRSFCLLFIYSHHQISQIPKRCVQIIIIHFLEPSVNWLPGVVLLIVILEHWTTIPPFIGIKILCMGARLAHRPSTIVAWVLYLTQHYMWVEVVGFPFLF